VNGDEIRNIRFQNTRDTGGFGYDASQVNDLLDRIAAELDAGRPARPLIANAAFRMPVVIRHCYDIDAVDWFLEELRRQEDPSELARMNTDPWRDLAVEEYSIRSAPGDSFGHVAAATAQECADAWRDFGQQPGTRLSWVRIGAVRRELRSAEQQTLASFRQPLFSAPMTLTLSAGGRAFTSRRVRRSSWPGIAETIGRHRPARPAHMLRAGKTPDSRDRPDPTLMQLLDETGMPVLYTSGRHFDRSAGAYIEFPGSGGCGFLSGAPAGQTPS
jgi:DivIVA domain-containing protein